MAFDRSKLSCLMQCSYGGEVWNYQTSDLKGSVIAANYFLPVFATLQNNDRIHCTYGIGGTVGHFDIAILASSSATVTILTLADYA